LFGHGCPNTRTAVQVNGFVVAGRVAARAFKSPLSQFLAEAQRRSYTGQIRTVHHGETMGLRTAGVPR
jgi:hypothetical protein